MDVKELLNKVGDQLSVGRAFGPAYEKDGTLVIPVAFVAGGGGGGGSDVPAQEASHESTTDSDSHVAGSGGGFGGVVLPVGVYVVNGERVRWMPAVNVTWIALSVLSVIGIFARSRANGQRRHR
jgi:uncharacterized spore protein YtfJ